MNYPYYYPQQQQQQQKTMVDFVQGEASADIYNVNPGQKVILFDIDNPFVYHKERDVTGRLTKKRFRLVEEPVQEEAKLDLSGYVRVEDLAAVVAEAVEKKFAELTPKTKKKTEEE